jgi:hypothetical protein
MIMKKFEYEVIAHVEDEDDIVEVCDEDKMIEWVNAFHLSRNTQQYHNQFYNVSLLHILPLLYLHLNQRVSRIIL